MASTFIGAVSDMLDADPTFGATFPGGLHYDAAPADPAIVYPYVAFAQDDVDRVGIVGRRYWAENVSLRFQINASGDMDIDVLAMTLESILFTPRGEGQEELAFAGGRCVHRRGGVKSIGLSRAMGVNGVDVFQATIESSWLVARDS